MEGMSPEDSEKNSAEIDAVLKRAEEHNFNCTPCTDIQLEKPEVEHPELVLTPDEYREKLLEENQALHNKLKEATCKYARECRAVEALQTELFKRKKVNRKLKHDYNLYVQENQRISDALNFTNSCIDSSQTVPGRSNMRKNGASDSCGPP